MSPGVDVQIDASAVSEAVDAVPELVELLERGVRAAVASAAAGASGTPTEGEISLALLGDADIRALNREHLGRDRPTDVIAFALWEEGEPVVGDVYVGADQARRQADEEGIPLREELLRLAVHGTLHVLGHDHPEGAEDRADSPMYGLQEDVVRDVLAGKG